MKRFFWPVLILSIIMAAGCAGDDDGESNGDAEVKVITSLPLLADLAREIGGDRVEVSSLLPTGADPHTFEPAPRDVADLASADIVFVNGLDLEPAVLSVIEANIPDGVPLIQLAEEAEAVGVEILAGGEREEEGADHEEEEDGDADLEGADPHLWMDVDHAAVYAHTIQEQLAVVDPDGAEAYQQNFDAYAAELDALAAELLEGTAGVPSEQRRLITAHDAFGYLAEYIGFEIAAFVSAGPGQDASPSDIADIVSAIEDGGIPAVFTEPQIGGESDTLAQAAADAGAEVCTLYSDAFDEDVSTYLEMMRFNANELARCLGGAE